MSKGIEAAPTDLSKDDYEASLERLKLDRDTLVVFDLDRTLIDSDRLADITLLSLEDGFDRVDDQESIAAIERVRVLQQQEVGNSFPYLEALQTEMKSDRMDWVEGLAKRVIDANRDQQAIIKQSFINQIMLPGAIELLARTDQLNADWMIMTAGQQATQLYKITLVQQILDAAPHATFKPLSYIVTDPHHEISKARMIQQSFLGGKTNLEPRFDPVVLSKYSTYASIKKQLADKQYGQVILVDDKPTNLKIDQTLSELNLSTVVAQADGDPDKPGVSLSQIQNLFTN